MTKRASPSASPRRPLSFSICAAVLLYVVPFFSCNNSNVAAAPAGSNGISLSEDKWWNPFPADNSSSGEGGRAPSATATATAAATSTGGNNVRGQDPSNHDHKVSAYASANSTQGAEELTDADLLTNPLAAKTQREEEPEEAEVEVDVAAEGEEEQTPPPADTGSVNEPEPEPETMPEKKANVAMRSVCFESGLEYGIKGQEGTAAPLAVVGEVPGVASAPDCQQECLAQEACTHFTWDSQELLCSLKNLPKSESEQETLKADSTVTSGPRVCGVDIPYCAELDVDIDAEGSGMVEDSPSPKACSESCRETRECDLFVWGWGGENTTCWMKKLPLNGKIPKAGVVSGTKSCSSPDIGHTYQKASMKPFASSSLAIPVPDDPPCFTLGQSIKGTEEAVLERTESAERCQTLCQMSGTCKAFTFDVLTNMCRLEADEGASRVEALATFVSGPRTCGWPRFTDDAGAAGTEGLSTETAGNVTPQAGAAIGADDWFVEATLAKMDLKQKISQMVIVPIVFLQDPAMLEEWSIGGLLWIPGWFRGEKSSKGIVNAWDNFYDNAIKPTGGRVPIPPLIATDAIHGHNNMPGATLFPHNIGLGCANDTDLMRRIGRATAAEVSVTGVDWTLAPTVAVTRDDRWGRTYESFAEEPYTAKRLIGALVRGIQGESDDPKTFLKDGKLLTTCKHFIGDGAPVGGITDGNVLLGEEELRRVHLPPFRACMSDGKAQAVMPSFTLFNGVHMHAYKFLITDVLKHTFDFDGLVVGDWSAHRAVKGCTVIDCPETINAGVDMLMVGDGMDNWQKFITNTMRRVREGTIPLYRIDDAVRRILTVKMRYGLIGPDGSKVKGKPSTRKYANQYDLLHSTEHAALAREAVRKSLVLLKNNNAALPLPKGGSVWVVSRLTAGRKVLPGKPPYEGADSPLANWIPAMTGAWSLEWQGDNIGNKEFPQATSVWKGIKLKAAHYGGSAYLSEMEADDRPPEAVDTVVVVLGELPYAEVYGDLGETSLALHARYPRDLELLDKVKATVSTSTKVVCVLLSGRPLYVNPHLNRCDAFVAAWLPGTEGGLGIADVLYGDRPFSAKLSYSWPARPCQAVVNDGSGEVPLFPFGHGFTYEEGAPELGWLEEFWAEECANQGIVMRKRFEQSQ
ncbi:unnamed protein product [Vitrella brassicaformis CCMP3155]|uniref:Apple domain-containing protein n=1 Tax=Vitrella brassicaformis (strain CCMP3155) TaxID=1169540 RepID=A0A0G4FUC6_VITBC|nr:unnamed protein product [Vitrella brassicaformis CCMP3155]|eukprot:CEM18332.1 unnamed protein product [Vitrella brassicaformis CCMP3155]